MPQTHFSCQTCLSVAPQNDDATAQSPLAPSPAQTFGNLRRAMFASLPMQVTDGASPLADWRASAGLGSLIPESWAYVGDVLRLYNGVISSECYLGSASQRKSLARIGALLGYEPRPAVGATAEIAAVVDAEAVVLNDTSYRGAPAPGEGPQIFECDSGGHASRKHNEYGIAPARDSAAAAVDEGVYLLEAATAAPVRGRPVVFAWFDNVIHAEAMEIRKVESVRGGDGVEYVAMSVSSDPGIGADVSHEVVSIQSPSQRAGACSTFFNPPNGAFGPETPDTLDDATIVNLLGLMTGGYTGPVNQPVLPSYLADWSQGYLYLDGVYRSISAGDMIVLQVGSEFRVHRVVRSVEELVPFAEPLEDPPKIPITRLTINPAIKEEFLGVNALSRLIIHYNLHDIGRMTRVAHTELTHALIVDKPLELEGIHDEPTNSPKRWILEDANGRGVLVDADLVVKQNGAATLTVRGPKWEGGLRVPVKAYGNVLDITRGETVRDEVLGDGDPSQPYQTFKLAKSPLTYLRAPNTERGIASTLEVRVGGILWHERASFYGAGPNDAVYIVRHDDDQNTYITFGDGVRGMRLPSGRGNVRASYRHGAGAAAPPPGAINQIARGVPGLLRVRSPIPAYGGADAETTREIRKHAPASALVLGRCVSLADFAARVARMPGIRNCKVEYAWVGEAQTAGVKVWYVPNDRDDPQPQLAAQIVADLQAMSEPGTMIRADAAIPVLNAFFINIEIEREREPGDVEAAVRAALLDPEKGLLALENTPIGGPLPRSALVAAVRAVPGVLDVTALYCYGMSLVGPFPAPGLTLAEGQYFDFDGDYAELIVVSAAHAESRGCHDLIA